MNLYLVKYSIIRGVDLSWKGVGIDKEIYYLLVIKSEKNFDIFFAIIYLLILLFTSDMKNQ